MLERAEVAPGIIRARVALEAGGLPKGWLTMAKDGLDFLTSETPIAPATGAPILSASQRGRAEMIAASHSPRNPNESMQLKMKFHFFSFQIAEKTGFRGFS